MRPDDYVDWINHPITKQFKEEMRLIRDSDKDATIEGDTETIIKLVHRRNAVMETIDRLINWKPEEVND